MIRSGVSLEEGNKKIKTKKFVSSRLARQAVDLIKNLIKSDKIR